jgi:hypothetical protein
VFPFFFLSSFGYQKNRSLPACEGGFFRWVCFLCQLFPSHPPTHYSFSLDVDLTIAYLSTSLRYDLPPSLPSWNILQPALPSGTPWLSLADFFLKMPEYRHLNFFFRFMNTSIKKNIYFLLTFAAFLSYLCDIISDFFRIKLSSNYAISFF